MNTICVFLLSLMWLLELSELHMWLALYFCWAAPVYIVLWKGFVCLFVFNEDKPVSR